LVLPLPQMAINGTSLALFLLIDKIIHMGKVDSLLMTEKIYVIENKSLSWEL